MAHFIHFVQQYSATLVDPYGRRYVARVYGACRPDDLWDGWFVFFPLDDGRAVATDRETTQGSLAAVRYWASGISTVYLDGALERARAMLPEAQLARRQAQAEGEEALARAEAAAYEAAAHAARKATLDADRRGRETEAMLLAERLLLGRQPDCATKPLGQPDTTQARRTGACANSCGSTRASVVTRPSHRRALMPTIARGCLAAPTLVRIIHEHRFASAHSLRKPIPQVVLRLALSTP